MLQAVELTIRLHPEDDVVIARMELATGTLVAKENVRAAVTIPAGHKLAVRDIAQGKPVRRYNQIIGFATRDIKAGEHVHVHNLAMGDFQRDYAFCSLKKDTEYISAGRDVPGHRARRWPRRDAQLHRHPHQRELLGDRGAHGRGSLQEPAGEIPERRRRGRAHAQDRLRHGVRRRRHGRPAPHDGGLRAPPELLRHAGDRPGLRGEPDQQPALHAEPQAPRPHARVHHPGEGRHDEGGARRHRAHRGDPAGSEQGEARDGAGEPSHARVCSAAAPTATPASAPIRRSARRWTCWCDTAERRSSRRPRRSTAPSTCSRAGRCRRKSAKSSSRASAGGRSTPRATTWR